MIYFDNSATTIQKPPDVAKAVAFAIKAFGNSGRSFYEPVLTANREIFKTRMEIAKLLGLDSPLNIAFTSSATESLNLVIGGLISNCDHVITTVLEHNSVLRPLYLKQCPLSFIGCDDNGNLSIDSFEQLLTPKTKFLVCIHGSNVTGNIVDAKSLYEKCRTHGITMILDVSQTLGSIPVSVDMADIFCFTGHKALFGPQGTGGIIVGGKFDFNIVKTGGAGVNSFDAFQSKDMPDIFEVGTLNGHSLYGLQKGVHFINELGVDAVHDKEMQLLWSFYDGLKRFDNITIYGDFSDEYRLPILSLNIGGLIASEVSEKLWIDYGIATRAGSHCAPLLHKHFGTENSGMVRFSFSFFNTMDEIEQCLSALEEIAKSSSGR